MSRSLLPLKFTLCIALALHSAMAAACSPYEPPAEPPLPNAQLMSIEQLAMVIGGRAEPHSPDRAMSEVNRRGDAVIPELARLVEDGNSATASDAALVLRDLGPRANAAVPALERRQQTADGSLRLALVEALAKIVPESSTITPVLAQMVESGDSSTAFTAAVILSDLGHRASAAAPALQRRQENAAGSLRLTLIEALISVAPESRTITSALVELQQSVTPDIHWQAFHDFLKVAAQSTTMTPALIELLQSTKVENRRVATLDLGNDQLIGRTAAVPSLIRALDDSDQQVREQAAQALGVMGPAGLAAEPALIHTLDGDDGLASSAAIALAKLGVHSDAITAKISERLHRTPELFPALTYLAALKDMHALGKLSADQLLSKFGPQLSNSANTLWSYLDQFGTAQVLPALEGLILSRYGTVPITSKREAFRRLSRFGRAGVPALHNIEKTATDQTTRAMAKVAIADAKDLQLHTALQRYLDADMHQLGQWLHAPEPALRLKAIRQIRTMTGGFKRIANMPQEEAERLASPGVSGVPDQKFHEFFYARAAYAELQKLASADPVLEVRSNAAAAAHAIALSTPAVLTPAPPPVGSPCGGIGKAPLEVLYP
jgi:HEAT repeat protein